MCHIRWDLTHKWIWLAGNAVLSSRRRFSSGLRLRLLLKLVHLLLLSLRHVLELLLVLLISYVRIHGARRVRLA